MSLLAVIFLGTVLAGLLKTTAATLLALEGRAGGGRGRPCG
jgi:hypothetical protein